MTAREATYPSAKPGRRFTDEAMETLMAHRWPGNVRELQNEVLRALALGDGDVLDVDLLSSRTAAQECRGSLRDA